ncbi:glutathione S-transferase protein [Ancylostoma caninum]|uniref:glutathione transferase n=1 Tax=Ancylostoma caninum TaxID=29170 RepID=A0A368GZE9_ANCCA|nr:glutathione S-transferase protein [Ancylostoma caninum]
MVQYKVTYFDGRGSAEIIRQIFVLADQEFEDVRLSQEEWPMHKSEMPFGQMPVLEVDGKQLGQSLAIVRFLARKFGFAGKSPFEEALVDSIADQWKDFIHEVQPCLLIVLGFAEGDLEKVAKEQFLPSSRKFFEYMTKFLRESFFEYMTKFLRESKSGYLVGDSLTFADLYLAESSAEFAKKIPALYDGFAEVKAHADKAHAEKVRSIPALKNWIETRPKTKF